MACNVQGLPQAVKSNGTSGRGATTNIIYKKRRGQHDAGLRQTVCWAFVPLIVNKISIRFFTIINHPHFDAKQLVPDFI